MLLISLNFSTLTAQSPVFRHFPQKELPFKRCYASVVDEEGFLLLASYNGVYRYNGTDFVALKRTQTEFIKTLDKQEDNRIFALGLSNTIYEATKDSLKLIYNCDDSDSYALEYVKDKKSLIISGKGNTFHRLNLESLEVDTINFISSKNQEFDFTFPKYLENDLLYFKAKKGDEYTLNTVNLKSYEIKTLRSISANAKYLKLFDFQDNKYLFLTSPKTNEDSLFSFNKGVIQTVPLNFQDSVNNNRFRIKVADDKLVFLSYKGLEIFNSELQKTQKLVKESLVTGVNFIGNSLWVSTNGSGLYFYPNYKALFFSTPKEIDVGHSLSQLAIFKNRVLANSINGKVIDVTNGRFKQLNNNSFKIHIDVPFQYIDEKLDTLYYPFLETDYLFYEVDDSLVIKEKKGYPGNKDRSYFEGLKFTASHNGLFVFFDKEKQPLIEKLLSPYLDNLELKTNSKGQSYYRLRTVRCNRNLFNPKDSSLWFTEKGSQQLFRNGLIDTITFNGKIAGGAELKFDEKGNVWFSDPYALYVEEDGIKQVANPLEKDEISNFSVYGDTILICTNNGLILFERKDSIFNYLNFVDGLPDNDIKSAVFLKDKIYVITEKTVGILPLQNDHFSHEIKAQFKSVKFNGEEYYSDSKNQFKLAYDQNDLEIIPISIDLLNLEHLKCVYKLTGINDEWITTNSREAIRYPNLASGDYEFITYYEDLKGNKSNSISFEFTIQLPFWKRWWFIALIVILVGSVITFLVSWRIRIMAKQQELNKKLIQSEIDGLKAQMNPHFIFNSLNSIQDLILSKDFKSSTIYLGKFSSLLRMTLEFSSKKRIYVEDEVELLSIYLELEGLRFENGFSSSVSLECDDLKGDKIPPMLIQPFVENALKHGLFQSTKKEKTLNVKFYRVGNFLYCTVEDNGVGRKAAQAYNESKAEYHISYASKAIQKRIDLINETLTHKIKATIIDLDEGTRVEIRFPV